MPHDADGLNHTYKQLEQDTVEALIRSGQIDRQEFEVAKAMRINNNQINLGYALVTFSHADEARKLLTKTQRQLFIEANKVDIFEKGRLDHSELDSSYFLRKMKNESKLAEKRSELREAKKSLREYERNIEEEMPSDRRLKEFKSIAQELIENPRGKTRRHGSSRRTQREQEELYEKIKAFQAENPGVDVSMLFESEQAERAKRLQHMKAFENYKNFEFLKAGISTKEAKPAKKRSLYEPFNYPPLERSVAQVLTEGGKAGVAIQGDNSAQNSSTMKRRGRRFSAYTEEEFLEAYLGKDFARRVDLGADEDNHTFGIQGRLSEMLPDKKDLLKYPKLLEEKERLKQYMGINKVDGEPIDPAMRELMEHDDLIDDYKETFEDTPHPTDPNRSRLKDYMKMLEFQKAKLEKEGSTVAEAADLHRIHARLTREYPDPYQGLRTREEKVEKSMQLEEQRLAALEKATEGRVAELIKGRGSRGSKRGGDGFEAESMFYPMAEEGAQEQGQKKQKKGGDGTQKQVRQKTKGKQGKQVSQKDSLDSDLHPFDDIREMELARLDTNLGSDLRKRKSNEGYNEMVHSMKRAEFVADVGTAKMLERQSALLTRARKQQFVQV